MLVRKAEIKDLDNIIQLWLEMMKFHESKDDKYKIRKDAKDIYRNYATKTILDLEKEVLVCEDKKNIYGYIFIEISTLPPVYEVNKIALLTEISVEQKMRRNGIGTLLLKSAEFWAKSKGVNRIECMVSINNDVSQSFWKKNGYIGYNTICCKDL